ncbi:Uncharacterised protein [uncultured archaeon]|nr:Uncharacterised protein [uncultured archaeon]
MITQMTNKSFTFAILSIFAMLTLMSFASAATLTNQNPTTFLTTSGSHTLTIDVTGTASEVVTLSLPDITQDGKTIDFTVAPSVTIVATGVAQSITISYTVPTDFVFNYGKTYSTILTATAASGNTSQTFSFPVTNPTKYTDNGDLSITIDDLSVKNGFGKDDDWFPLDDVNAKIVVENSGTDKIKNIVVEWGLYDQNTGKFVMKEKESDFNLNDGDDKTLNIPFKLDEVNKFDNSDTYVFYAWATGEDEAHSDDKTSTYDSASINMINDESDFVVLGNIQISDSVSCGDDVHITADVWNIGTDDQDKVYVIISESTLGINQKVSIGDISSFDNGILDATIKIPQDAESEKNYVLKLSVYGEDGLYQNDYDDSKSQSDVWFKVSGTCSAPVTIAASLQSEARTGQELKVKTTITNTDSKAGNFTLDLSGYSSWAELVNVNKTSFTVNAGASQDVIITFKVNDDASGSQNFNIGLQEGTKTFSQQVSVPLTQSSGFSLSGITGLFTSGNKLIWAIGALNAILILVIIIVAVKVVRKK